MDLKKINEFLKSKWFQVLILLGIFVLLWKPNTNISTPIKENTTKTQTKSLFRDISVSPKVENNSVSLPKNTVFTSDEESDNTISEENPLIVPTGKDPIGDNERAEENKKIVIDECLRRQPLLGENRHWGIFEKNNYPSINYMTKAMENRYGYYKFYSDVDRAVTLIMKAIGDE